MTYPVAVVLSPPMTTTGHLNVNVKLRIDGDLDEELKRLALLGDRSVAAEMRRALRHWVAQARDDEDTVRVLNEASQ